MNSDHCERLAGTLSRAAHVLLDFDGPVCSVFAGFPAPTVAAELRALVVRHGGRLPHAAEQMADPLVVLRYVALSEPGLTRVIEDALCAAEIKAAETAQPTPGTTGFLNACRDAGRLVTVVSNNSVPAVTRYLKHAGLAHLVTHVEGRVAYHPEWMKPHPHLVNQAVRHSGVTVAATVLIGDSTTDVEAATAAGVTTIGFANRPEKVDPLTDSGAAVVIRDMNELVSHVAKRPTTPPPRPAAVETIDTGF